MYTDTLSWYPLNAMSCQQMSLPLQSSVAPFLEGCTCASVCSLTLSAETDALGPCTCWPIELWSMHLIKGSVTYSIVIIIHSCSQKGLLSVCGAKVPCVSGKLGSICWKGGRTGHTATLWMTLLQGKYKSTTYVLHSMNQLTAQWRRIPKLSQCYKHVQFWLSRWIPYTLQQPKLFRAELIIIITPLSKQIYRCPLEHVYKQIARPLLEHSHNKAFTQKRQLRSYYGLVHSCNYSK